MVIVVNSDLESPLHNYLTFPSLPDQKDILYQCTGGVRI